MSDLDLPTYQDVEEAAEILKGVSNVTPVQTSRTLNEEILCRGIQCFVKCENLQRMGAFKFRGGFNALSHFTKEERDAGVLTHSSGNHAQAVALSASILKMKATIIMPKDAPTSKLEATQDYGGNVVLYDRYKQDCNTIADELQARTGAVLLSPFDDKYVIAGQGTAGKELFEDLQKSGVELDYLFVCVGGGGLISGCALAAHALAPSCKIIGVEPEAGNDAQQSLERGEIVQIEAPKTIADGAQTRHIGKLNMAIMQRHVEQIITVSDEELISCMKFFGERMKLIVEPTGCLALAGLKKLVKSGEVPPGSKCGVIISGGNVDMSRYCQLVG